MTYLTECKQCKDMTPSIPKGEYKWICSKCAEAKFTELDKEAKRNE